MKDYKYMVFTLCSTYNQSNYIKETLDGFCMQQTNFPFVCGIIDDASTDGEQEVLKQYLEEHFYLDGNAFFQREENDNYIRFFARHKENQNCSFLVVLLKTNHYQHHKDRMRYVAEWRDSAKYYAICEGDDYWINPLKLQRQVSFLEENKEYTMCCHNANKLIVQDNKFVLFSNHKQSGVISAYDAIHRWIIPTASIVIRSEMNISPVWETKIYSGDYSLIIRCLYYGKIFYFKDVMSVYRFNTKGSSSTASVQGNPCFWFEQHIKLLESYYNAPDQKYKKVIKWRIKYLKNEIDFNNSKTSKNLFDSCKHIYFGGKKFIYNKILPILL